MSIQLLISLPLIIEVLHICCVVKHNFEVLRFKFAHFSEVIYLMEKGLGMRQVLK